jgi:hypothetical protein
MLLARRTAIRPAAIADCDAVTARLRVDDVAEAAAVAGEARLALHRAFSASLMPPKVGLLGAEVAALWGLCGHELPHVGVPWLLMTPAIEQLGPLASYFVRVARRELAAMLMIRPRLENYVTADYAKLFPLLEQLGFRIDEPVRLGPQQSLFRRFWIEV